MKFFYATLYLVNSLLFASAQSKPGIFQPGIISRGEYESHLAFTPTGDTLYFIKCSYDLWVSAICVCYRRNWQWSAPEVASFSGKYMDADPFVAKDGRKLYFMSNRPLKAGNPVKDNTDLWKVVRENGWWGDPVHLGPAIDSGSDEYYPTLADNCNLYFGSPRPGGSGQSDIWCSKLVNGRYQVPVNLGDVINTLDSEYEAYIPPDESYLLFNSTSTTLNSLDFYISFNQNGRWTKAKKLLTPFNSGAIEWSPKVTRNGKTFYFSSTLNTGVAIPGSPYNMSQLNHRLHSAGNSLADIYTVDFKRILQAVQ